MILSILATICIALLVIFPIIMLIDIISEDTNDKDTK